MLSTDIAPPLSTFFTRECICVTIDKPVLEHHNR